MASCWVIVLPPATTAPARRLSTSGAAKADRVDAEMVAEAPVLGRDHRLDQPGRDLVQRHEAGTAAAADRDRRCRRPRAPSPSPAALSANSSAGVRQLGRHRHEQHDPGGQRRPAAGPAASPSSDGARPRRGGGGMGRRTLAGKAVRSGCVRGTLRTDCQRAYLRPTTHRKEMGGSSCASPCCCRTRTTRA